MAVERTYTIPLRKEWLKSVKYKRAKKAVRAIREFLMRHMKVKEMESVKIGKYLNLELWKHSIKNPPARVKVNVTKDDKGIVQAELFGAPKEAPKVEAPKKLEANKPEEKKTESPVAEQKAATQAPAAPAEKKPRPKKPAAPNVPNQPVPALPQQAGHMIR